MPLKTNRFTGNEIHYESWALSGPTGQILPEASKMVETFDDQGHLSKPPTTNLNNHWYMRDVSVAVDRRHFSTYVRFDTVLTSKASGNIKVRGIGTVTLWTGPKEENIVKLANVLHAPSLPYNLLGLKALHDAGYCLQYQENGWTLIKGLSFCEYVTPVAYCSVELLGLRLHVEPASPNKIARRASRMPPTAYDLHWSNYDRGNLQYKHLRQMGLTGPTHWTSGSSSVPLSRDWILKPTMYFSAAKDRQSFTSYRPFNLKLTSSYWREVEVIGIGDVDLRLNYGKSKYRFHDVLHCPNIPCNFLGFKKIMEEEDGFEISKENGFHRIVRWGRTWARLHNFACGRLVDIVDNGGVSYLNYDEPDLQPLRMNREEQGKWEAMVLERKEAAKKAAKKEG